jgi:hypothetical protein
LAVFGGFSTRVAIDVGVHVVVARQQPRADDNRLAFSSLKVHREWYFVEYTPPIHGNPFATLDLTLLEPSDPGRVAQTMEVELLGWLQRYPVPIMVSAFTDSGDLFPTSSVRTCDHLVGWLDAAANQPAAHWRVVPSAELPQIDLSAPALQEMYSDVPFRTGVDLQARVNAHRRKVRTATVLVFVWLVVVPAIVLLIEFNAPEWLSWLVLLYSLSQVYIQGLKLYGLWPKTPSEIEAADEERRIRHHHYHCERNPDGFRRLVVENIERETREQTHREAARIKLSGRSGGD